MLTQIQFLNLILSSKDFSYIINNNITVDFFPNFKDEFNFIYNHYKQYGQTPDVETFLKSFPEFEILNVNEPPEYLLSELYKDKDQNFLVKTFNNIKDLLVAGKTDEAMNKFLNASQNAYGDRHMDAVNILEDISRYDAYIDKCNNFNKYYIPTGFRELDNVLGGIDRQGELGVVAARSGVGKSWMLIKLATAAVKQGLTVGVFSGEMVVDKVAYRFDTLMSHISNSQLVHGNISAANDYMAYLKTLKDSYPNSKLYVLTRDMVGDHCGVNALRSFIEKYNLDILFIDQLSLLDDDRHGRTDTEQAANISKDLKILQTAKKIPIMSVSQQNREKIEEGAYAGTENISRSDRIAQDATIILFLTVKDNILTVSIGKGRDGGTGQIFKYSINIDEGRYEYIMDDGGNDYESYESEEEPF